MLTYICNKWNSCVQLRKHLFKRFSFVLLLELLRFYLISSLRAVKNLGTIDWKKLRYMHSFNHLSNICVLSMGRLWIFWRQEDNCDSLPVPEDLTAQREKKRQTQKQIIDTQCDQCHISIRNKVHRKYWRGNDQFSRRMRKKFERGVGKIWK